MPKFRSLHRKLAIVLLALCLVFAALQIVIALHMFQLYDVEATQKLNRNLAKHLIEQNLLASAHGADVGRLEALFDRQMRVNPAIEIYWLDAGGKVVACTSPLDYVKRQSVSLAPIARFLRGDERYPIYGDDPRRPGERNIFSVAAIPGGEGSSAYLYVVLASSERQSILDMLRGSYVFRVSLLIIAAALMFTALTALVILRWLTRRVMYLTHDMEEFQRSNFASQHGIRKPKPERYPDEIDRLAAVYDDMAKQIAQLVDQLKQRDARRRELIANIVHDLKTPLTVMKGYVDTLLLKANDLTETQRQSHLSIASRNATKLGRMLSDLLELTKLEASERQPEPENFSVVELLHDVASKFRLEADAKAIRIDVSAPDGVNYVCADIAMVERVLENLVGNAIAHTGERGVIRLMAQPEADRVFVQVSDSGAGIAAADLPHIFDRFFRAAPDNADAPPHLGLGLAITKRILDLHGSEIKVESQLGAGTRFTFVLPGAV